MRLVALPFTTLGLLLLIAGCGGGQKDEADRFAPPDQAGSDQPAYADPRPAFTPLIRVHALNAEQPQLFAPAVMDSLLAAEQGRPVPERIGLWARRFLADSTHTYLFGGDAGGYVTEGVLVDDDHLDCVSLVYRATDLARATDSRDAVQVALQTRFPGADPDSLIDAGGRVDYDVPQHLDYSLDMVRSGNWGEDITNWLPGAVRDRHGSARFAKGSFFLVPEQALQTGELREGDILWLVLDPENPAARALRDEHGLVIGHLGIVIVDPDGQRWLVHAASKPLEGRYEGGRVVKVPVKEYLDRVDRFAGVIVTRFPAGT